MSYRQVACPKCALAVRVANSVAGGATLKCPSCQGLFRLPASVPPASPLPMMAPRPAAPVRSAPTPGNGQKAPPPPPMSARPAAPAAARPGVAPPRPAAQSANGQPAPTLADSNRQSLLGKQRPVVLGAAIGGGVALLLLLVIVLMLLPGGGSPVAQNEPSQGGNNGTQPGDPNKASLINLKNAIEKVDPLAGAKDPFADQKLPEGKPLLVLDTGGHVAPVKSVLFTPDGKKVITASMDKTVRIWNLATGETERVYRLPIGPGNEGVLYAAALSKDGQRLAVGGVPFGMGKHGSPVYIISLATNEVEKVLHGHTNNISGLGFSPDGKYLASASMSGIGLIHEVVSGRMVKELKGHAQSLRSISFAPDGTLVATTSYDDTTRIWDPSTGTTLAVLSTLPDHMFSHAWSHDSQTLATGTFECSIQLWTRAGQLKQRFKVPFPEVIQFSSLQFTKNNSELLYTGVDKTGRAGLISVQTGQIRLIFPHHNNSVFHGDLSPDGQLAASTGGDVQETFIWRVQDGTVIRKLQGKGPSIWGVGWSPDGNSFAWGTENRGNFQMSIPPLETAFDLTTHKLGRPAPGQQFSRSQLASPGGYSLSRIDFFKIAVALNGQQVGSWKSPRAGDRIYSFTTLGADRAVMGGSFAIYLVDLKNGQILREYDSHSALVSAVAPAPNGRYFLSGSQDQTICLWSPERSEPILTFFSTGTDWIAWSPAGYYSCSANGERLMGWQINRGPESLAAYFEAVRFRQSLFRPEVLKHLVKTGDLQQALTAAGDKQQEPEKLVSVGQVLPPQVKIVTPVGDRGDVVVKDGKLTVTAAAKSVGNHPVTGVRLIVDGRPYRGNEGLVKFDNPQLGVRSATWNVDLPAGKHFLMVQAESAVSKAMSEPVVVVCEGGSKTLPNLYVLSVGINEYEGENKLNFATKDATTLAGVLQSKGNGVFGKVEINVVTDHNATRAGILKGLEWMAGKMTANDVGVFFFGGHGTRDPWGNFHLVPIDMNPMKPRETCLSGETVKKSLANMPGKLLCIFDACHSGAAATPDDLIRDLVTEDYGVIVMCSSLGKEYSLESGLIQHGVFTLGLVEGLKGAADVDNDQVIYIHEMDQFANQFVKQMTKGIQNPITARPPSIPSFALSKK